MRGSRMKLVAAPDKFRGTATAREMAAAIAYEEERTEEAALRARIDKLKGQVTEARKTVEMERLGKFKSRLLEASSRIGANQTLRNQNPPFRQAHECLMCGWHLVC